MLIIGIILFGMLIGAAAQLILGRQHGKFNWPMAFVSGLVGSFVGGLLISLLSGDGLAFRPSGIIGSIVGAHPRDGDLAVVAGTDRVRQALSRQDSVTPVGLGEPISDSA